MASGPSTYQQSGPSAPQTARAVLFSGPEQVKGFGAKPAFLTAKDKNGRDALLIQARAAGVGGESITVTFVAAGNNTPLTVAVVSNAITVNLATDGAANPTSTAAAVRDAINASAPASALVAAAVPNAADPSAVIAAATVASLAGDAAASSGTVSNAPLPSQHPAHNAYNTARY